MNVKIVKGQIEYLDECTNILIDSKLGDTYFPDSNQAKECIMEAISKGEFYVSIDSDNQCVGFIWFVWNGMFYRFPYIHMFVVKTDYRGKGIGKEMLSFVERITFEKSSKVFLMVDDYTGGAKEFYINMGYEEIGQVGNLFKNNVISDILMKVRPQS